MKQLNIFKPAITLRRAIYGTAGLLLLCTIMSGIVLASTTTHAVTKSSTATVNVTMSCTMSISPGPGGTATTDGYSYSATIDPGQYAEINGTIMTTTCTGAGNYSLYAIGYSGDSYDTPTNTQMISSNTGVANIPTGTATSGGTSNWAFKLATSGSYSPTIISPYNNYANIPGDDFTKIATYIPGTTGSAATSSVQAKYRVYITSTQPAGNYTGKVKYTMVYPNDAPAPRTKPYMQDMVASDCTTTATTVYDNRDGEAYLVQRLADGKCWMLDNLRLDLVDSTVQGNLTSDTTNAEDSSLAYLKGTATYRDPTQDPNGKYPSAGLNSTPWTSSSQNFYSVPMIMSSGTCYNAYCVDSPASGQWNSEVVTPQTINGVTSIAQGKVGIYYNYCAISAGAYCYGNGTASDGSPASDPDPSSLQDVKEDICPKGWRLPTSTDAGEFQDLYTAYSSNVTDFQTALDTPLSGFFFSGTARNQGNFGYFWSSTWYSANYMRCLSVGSSNVNLSNRYYRSYGLSARCILGS